MPKAYKRYLSSLIANLFHATLTLLYIGPLTQQALLRAQEVTWLRQPGTVDRRRYQFQPLGTRKARDRLFL